MKELIIAIAVLWQKFHIQIGTELCGTNIGLVVGISHVKCLVACIFVMIALMANARTARDAYLQEKNESLFRFAQDESDSVLPVFGRYVVLPDGRKTRALRSIENRLNGYFHECILRQPIKVVSPQSVRRWKSNRIRFRSYDKLSGEKFYELQNQLEELTDLTAQIAAECYRYGLDSSMWQAVEIINGCYSSGSYGMWESVSRRRKGSVARVREKFNQIEQILHSQLDMLDGVHMREFEAWKLANKADASEKQRESLVSKLSMCKTAENAGQSVVAKIKKEAEEREERRRVLAAALQRQNDEVAARTFEASEINRRQQELNDNIERTNRKMENFKREIELQFPGTIFLP